MSKFRRGAAANQYALVVGLIVVVAILAVTSVGSGMSGLFTNISNQLGGTGNFTSTGGSGGGSGGGGGGGSGVPTPPGSVVNPVAWGWNTNGVLGNGTTTSSSAPVNMTQFTALGSLKAVLHGNSAGYALTSSGTVYAIGMNNWGNLGVGDTTARSTLTQVRGVGGSGFLTGITKIFVHNSASPCAINAAGNVFCWGLNGVAGAQITSPGQLAGPGGSGTFSGAVEAGGAGVSCAIDGSGNLYCWGNGFWGNLGNGSTGTATFPTQVRGEGGTGFLTGVTQLAEGNGSHTCAMAGGFAYCWGRNTNGMLGIGTTSNTLYPGKVRGVGGSGFLTGISWLTAGNNNTCAIVSGQVYCWGTASNGSNGDNNTTTDRTTPVAVKGVGGAGNLTGMTLVEAGADFACAMGSGNVYCWGDNNSGKLGGGGSIGAMSSVPVQVVGVGGSGVLTGVTWISVAAHSVYAWR